MIYVNPVNPLLNRTSGMTGAGTEAQQKAALQEFEHLFLYSLLRQMHESVTVSGEKKGHEMQLFEEMLDDALAGEMARSGQVGVARQIERQMAAPRVRG
jgi:Rod binding domain-containing protein